MKKLLYVGYILVALPVLAEIALRIYNPFPPTLIGDTISLPVKVSRNFTSSRNVKGLDSLVVTTHNALGFRGPEWPRDRQTIRIMAIGGSTTECALVLDGKTWEDELQRRVQNFHRPVWINNAGLDGHSTFGHLALLNQYVLKLHPDICIFLTGANDLGRTDLNSYDITIINKRKDWVTWMAYHSRLANLMVNLYRTHRAKKLHLVHVQRFSLESAPRVYDTDSAIDAGLAKERPLAMRYHDRLLHLVRLCRQNGIEPVLMTQPLLLGEGTDSLTGVNLETAGFNEQTSGKILWKRLELYNEQTKAVATAEHVFFIDLAHQLPKSSRYFYDPWHYNNEGCHKVGEIVADRMESFLLKNY